jgi:hypothetical protein
LPQKPQLLIGKQSIGRRAVEVSESRIADDHLVAQVAIEVIFFGGATSGWTHWEEVGDELASVPALGRISL